MHSLCITLIVCHVASLALGQDDFAPIVQLTTGKVRGSVQKDDSDRSLYFYNGIPYGKTARFSVPTFADSWEGIYNATQDRDACPQPVHDPLMTVFQGRTFSESCLYVNVWRPTTEKVNRPVMVWIHGGGFTIGTIFSITSNGIYIASQGDVIVVAVNYRLGPFGFLYGGTEDAPGNLGFQDQILALKWVQANIHQFGGDPNQVTLFGESAGSASVGALILSPLAQNLFHRAIMQSGAPIHVDTQNSALTRTKAFASLLNCPTEKSNKEIVTCLRNITMEELMKHTSLDFIHNDYFKPLYGDTVLPVPPIEALNNGKFNRDIDLLFGICQNEGTYFVTKLYPELDANTTLTREDAKRDIVQVMKSYNYSFADEVAEFYLANLTISATQDELKEAVALAIGEHRIDCPTVLFSEQMAKISKYKSTFYSYILTQHYAFPGTEDLPWHGVAHGEDVAFLFLIPLLGNDDNRQLSRDMIQTWTQFAKHGNPGKLGEVQWNEALNATNPFASAVKLHSNQYKMVNEYFSKNCDTFWKPKIFH